MQIGHLTVNVSNHLTPDHIMQRLLLINPHAGAASANAEDSAKRALSYSLIFSGVRCVLQYALLPFVLPMLGIAADAAIPLMLVLTVLAMISIFFSLRRFWQIGYTHRWQYLAVALVALTLLVAFMLLDLNVIAA